MNSFTDINFNISETLVKMKPRLFWGIYLTISFLRYFPLFFSVFNFDAETKLNAKLEFLKNYFENKSLICQATENLLLTFAIISVYLIVTNLAIFVINYNNKNINPQINKTLNEYDEYKKLSRKIYKKCIKEFKVQDIQEYIELISIDKPLKPTLITNYLEANNLINRKTTDANDYSIYKLSHLGLHFAKFICKDGVVDENINGSP